MDDQLLKILSALAVLLVTLLAGKKRKAESLPEPVLTHTVEEEDPGIPRELWDTELTDEPQRDLEHSSATQVPNAFQEAASLETLAGLESSLSSYDRQNAPAVSLLASVVPEEEEEGVQLSDDGELCFNLRKAILYQTILERPKL